jgi:hypothetical protein
MGQYLENTGSAPVRFLAAFKSSYRMSMTRPELVIVHLELLTSDGTLLKTKGSRGVPRLRSKQRYPSAHLFAAGARISVHKAFNELP